MQIRWELIEISQCFKSFSSLELQIAFSGYRMNYLEILSIISCSDDNILSYSLYGINVL